MNLIEELKQFAVADTTTEATRRVLLEAILELSKKPEPIVWPVPQYPQGPYYPWTYFDTSTAPKAANIHMVPLRQYN